MIALSESEHAWLDGQPVAAEYSGPMRCAVVGSGDRIFRARQVEWLGRMTAAQPAHMAREILKRHERVRRDRGYRVANLDLVDHAERYRGRIPANASDKTLKEIADQHAATVKRAVIERHEAEPGPDMMRDWCIGQAQCSAVGIEPPRPSDPSDPDELRGCVKRMKCPHWWRRQIRVAFGRRIEQSARALGMVRHRRNYAISPDGFDRWQQREEANRQTLADCVAINDAGTELSLADIAAAGVSNPRVRRAELMTRISGLEQCAESRGDVSIMVTWTVPPELHAYDERGRECAGRHVTPREGHQWLRHRWQLARAAIHRRGLTMYGVRVVEPHADGTPHWHMLLFIAPDDLEAVESVLARYVIDGDQRPERIRYGYDSTRIDRTRGTAAGYVAKYVAKSIDGHALDMPTTRDAYGRQAALDLDPGEAANRVRAWASQWGIRQFQFVGAPPVGPWRELRRIEPIDSYRQISNPALARVERLREAADTGKWSIYCELMGGPCLPANERPARIRYVKEGKEGRYGDLLATPFVEAYGVPLWTRQQKWEIEYRPGEGACLSAGWSYSGGEAGASWTRGNNCTEGIRDAATTTHHTRESRGRAHREKPDAQYWPGAGPARRGFRHSGRTGAPH